MDKTRLALVLMGAGLVVAVIVIIILSVVLVEPSPKCDDDGSLITPSYRLQDSVAVTEGLSGIRRENLKEYHRFLSEKPHPSGSERDGVDIVNFLENSLRESGFDEVKKVPYLLVHPLPDPEHPNSVRLVADNGTVLLDAKMTEDKIPGIDTDIGPAYLAFSARGTVEVRRDVQ
ncbi:N-acetylated-alpha-linked acidic dipeptidase 2 [Ixodes scapularis]